MKKILPVLIALPLLVIASAGGAFIALQILAPGAANANSAPAAHAAPETSLGPTLLLKERVINLADPGAQRYLKIAASLEFRPNAEFAKADEASQEKLVKEFRKSMASKSPIIEDAIISICSSKKSTELMTIEGKEKLKAELIERIKKLVKEPEMVNIYFTDFVMQ